MEKIRVGVLLESFDAPAWIRELIRILTAAEYAEITFVSLTGQRSPALPRSFLFRHLLRFEKKRFRAKPDAFKDVSLEEVLSGLPVIQAEPAPPGGTFSPDILSRIASCKPDVILALSGVHPRGPLLGIPRYGIWSLEPPPKHGTAAPGGFWEFLLKEPSTRDALYLLREPPDSCAILSHSISPTDTVSFRIGRSRRFWKILHLIPRLLHRLAVEGEDAIILPDGKRDPFLLQHREEPEPTNRNLLLPLARHFFLLMLQKLRRSVAFDQWILLYAFGNGMTTDLGRFRKMIPPKEVVWADPFVVARDDRYFIFIEECPRRPKKGHISVIVMDKNGRFEKPRTVLDRPYHLSYPFILEWEGNLYMIPESSADRSVQLFRCADFPDRWEFERNLITGLEIVDSTLLYSGDRWWLFCSIKENDGYPNWDELFVFHADHPVSGSWIPHPANPVVSDATRARPAGRIFERDGYLYRPSQDCSRRYGYGIRINRITKLTPTEYREEEISFIEPLWDPSMKGVHTLASGGSLTVIDGLQRRWRKL